jgi:hypothetical protein
MMMRNLKIMVLMVISMIQRRKRSTAESLSTIVRIEITKPVRSLRKKEE